MIDVKSKYKVDSNKLLQLELLTSLEKYTKAMYKAQFKRSFVVNWHHRLIFEALERVVDGKCKRLMINMPPRYSKTEIVIKQFFSWCYALNPASKFLHLSYSDMLVKDNSDMIRQIMQLPAYTTLFPNSRLENNRANTTRWKTAAGGEMYAVSTQGQVTGFGAGKVDDDTAEEKDDFLAGADDEFLQKLGLIGANTNVFEGALVIDDPLKPEDADSDTIRERVNQRFDSTIRNRVNSRNTPIIIIMQRLHEHDLCGYLQELEADEWEILSLPAITEDKETGKEVPLWGMKHTLEELKKLREKNPHIFDTQYMQDPKPKEGLMYQSFGTYEPEQLPVKGKRMNYTDTADTGADNLCSIDFIDTPEYQYVIDVLFTNKPMEFTEPALAKMLNKNKIEVSKIESNNGGRGFARAVRRLLRINFKNRRTAIRWFTQSKNKFSRIYSASAEVQDNILFPVGWETKWPEFYRSLMSYRKDNKRKSQHDDAADCLTGVYEMHGSGTRSKKVKQNN